MSPRNSRTNDGKYLENEVEKFFNTLNRIDIAVDRLPDTRSARNVIKAQNADFLISSVNTRPFYLECKSIGGAKRVLRHFRQYPQMLRWAQAGMPGRILAHYYDQQLLRVYNVLLLRKVELLGKQWNDPISAVIYESDLSKDGELEGLKRVLYYLVGDIT